MALRATAPENASDEGGSTSRGRFGSAGIGKTPVGGLRLLGPPMVHASAGSARFITKVFSLCELSL